MAGGRAFVVTCVIIVLVCVSGLTLLIIGGNAVSGGTTRSTPPSWGRPLAITGLCLLILPGAIVFFIWIFCYPARGRATRGTDTQEQTGPLINE
jgi:hypothetical protein